MEQKGLLFIPDISGFSRFVTETEIDHSRLIIQELLEILINANEIGLEISEIEGDAILFYKFGEPPALEKLYQQVAKMFCNFHRSLMVYEQHRYCYCKACVAAKDLTLKVITHYGEFTGYNIKNFQKLIGKDLIVAHQLLKNDLPEHEYWMVTRKLAGETQPAGFASWMRWDSGVKHAETGDIPFHYTTLCSLKNELPPVGPPSDVLENKVKLISVGKEYDTNMNTLFHATGDFSFRNRWQEGVTEVEVMSHYLPRVGMRCRGVRDGKEYFIFSSSVLCREHHVEFSETEEKTRSVTWFTIDRLSPQRSKLTLDLYVDRNIASQIPVRWFRKARLRNEYVKSLDNLAALVRELHFPGEELGS
ncbi:MAG TPA: DUF2652 domain-containing protein [Chryseosolibacter sp.]